MDRVILHCDLNSFYASVELLDYPEYRDVPMAVCGDPDSRHGIILAKNEPAKRFGVKTAETIYQARRKCPQLILLPPHHEKYRKISQEVNRLYQRYTDQVEPFGIDESWLDVTGSTGLFGTGMEIAHQIREEVRRELKLTISVGVSFNKVFAKLGSDYKKPDAITEISRENYRQIVHPLPVTDLLFVGQVTAKRLGQMGIHTIGQLARVSPLVLETTLGKQGLTLHQYSTGEDTDPVRRYDEQDMVKSVGNSTTYPRDLTTLPEIRAGLMALCDEVAWRLRKGGLKCRGVQLSLKDPQFHVIDRQAPLDVPTQLTSELFAAVVRLLEKNWSPGSPVRLLSVTAIQLLPAESAEQLDLFTDPERRERLQALEQSVDKLRDKYGRTAVAPAVTLRRKRRDEEE